MKINDNYIFKYAPINVFTYKNLLISQLWFGPPDSMNDQLEGLIKVKNKDFKPSKKALNHFISLNGLRDYYYYSDPLEEIQKHGFIKFFLNNWYHLQRNKYGISCFSSTPKEPLMWSHYANKHTGICLIYNKHKLMEGLFDSGFYFDIRKINYKERPTLELLECNGEILINSNEPVLFSKNSKWKYEKEIRISFLSGETNKFIGRSFTTYPSALEGVIYGVNINEDDLDSISYVLRNDPLYAHVKEYFAEIDYEKGSIKIKED
ncbi:DUF2971 domain-containing protein [Reichenbachiella agarivorans]|uniref:DUF2971 domain-containing protein n=1 Tax=Reichenbachiella agarivorans TaxID=2979464 RepID=A0ABY6CTC0_9BACT|nr:DUF2971 domain-containing protein [Reichenbachiella agarivorans]UXP32708.1 DUF2971 domain-containing protein [Reichenbachiella agarivorans]